MRNDHVPVGVDPLESRPILLERKRKRQTTADCIENLGQKDGDHRESSLDDEGAFYFAYIYPHFYLRDICHWLNRERGKKGAANQDAKASNGRHSTQLLKYLDSTSID